MPINSRQLLNYLSVEFGDIADKAYTGDLDAWNDLGLSLLTKWLDEGDDVSLDHSVSCFLHAARKGHAKAQFNLAMAYFAGFRMQNCLRAVEWFRRSAENGEPWAMYVMGLMEEIVEVGKDEEDGDDLEEGGDDLIDCCLCDEALVWFSRAASAGNAYAKLAMALAEDIGHAPRESLQRVNEKCEEHWEFPLCRHNYEMALELYEQVRKSGLDWGFVRSRHAFLTELLDDTYKAAEEYLDILNHFEIPDREDFMRYVDGSFYDDSLSGWFSCKAEAQDFELRNGRIQDGVFLCRGILRSPCRFIFKFGFRGAHGFAAYRLLWMSSHPRSCHPHTISISSNIRSLCRDTLQGMAYHGCCGGYYPVEDYSTDDHFISNGDTFIECLFAGMNNLYERSRRRQHGKLKYYRYVSFVDGGVDCGPIYIDRALAVDEKDVVYTWVSALRKFVRTSWTRRHSVSNSTCISFRSAMRIMKQFEKDAEAVDSSRGSLFVEFRRRCSPRWQSYAQWWREYCPFDNGGSGLPYLKRDSYSKARMCNLIHNPGIGDMSCEGDPEEDD